MFKQSNDLYDIMSSWNSFYSEEPCAVVDQPVRQEESLQRAILSKAYKKAYEGVRFGDDFEIDEVTNNDSNEKVMVKSREFGK